MEKSIMSRDEVRTSIMNIIKGVEAELVMNESCINREESSNVNSIINEQVEITELELKDEYELEYNDSIIRCKSRKQCFIDKHKRGSGEEVGISEHTNNTKLLRIILDKFDGEFKRFNEFWPSFVAIVHDNSSLSKVEKFN
ncbi:integrase catalytic domain-containing protein [Nephila pilipes]|uniref:Integrase catalytic domain-containing protein n=1 Tax=Nephila pilipes TaxID=299642 RepID=A0A8X6ITM2_NEPPI|nr:integrase catalytic domain-containing protein [Nephila pilipes]